MNQAYRAALRHGAFLRANNLPEEDRFKFQMLTSEIFAGKDFSDPAMDKRLAKDLATEVMLEATDAYLETLDPSSPPCLVVGRLAFGCVFLENRRDTLWNPEEVRLMPILSSLRILDFSTLLPGPFATMMLADMGADILRIEAPDRFDMLRSRPPFDDGVSAGHLFLMRSKRSLALDLKKPGAVDIVKRLIMDYDVVLEQFRPGVMKRLGLDYETLSETNPRLIYCSLTGYGQDGPMRDRAGHDDNYLSLAGVMSHTGDREKGPIPLGVQVADLGAGSFMSIIGMLSAVVHREKTGDGQYIDVSMFDGSLLWNGYAAAEYLVSGTPPSWGTRILNGGSHYGYYKTKDGRYLSSGSLEPQFWEGFCKALGRPDLIERRALPGPEMDAVVDEIRAVIARKTLEEWMAIFSKVDVCVEPVLDLEEAFAHPQTVARDMIVEVPKPDGTTQRQVGSPIKFSGSEPRYTHVGCALGEHTEQVLMEAGYAADAIMEFRRAGLFGTPPKA